jgi:general secretion pathway protein J
MKRSGGFTLMEVLAALALLALLLVGVYSGIRTATHTVRSGSAAIERLDKVRSAQQFLRRELAQAMAQPIGRDTYGDDLFFKGTVRELQFVAPLPGYLGKLGPQIQTLALVGNGHGGQRLEVSFAQPSSSPSSGDQPRQSLGQPVVLLDDVRQGSFSFRGRNPQGEVGNWSTTWPDGRLLPSLVRIDLQLAGTDYWPELEAPLRVDPAANQGSPNPLHGVSMRPVGR